MKRWPELSVIGVLAATLVFAALGDGTPRTASPARPDAPAVTPASASFVIRDVRVFDGDKAIQSTSVIVRDGRIEALGTDLDASGLAVVDGQGKTLMPGFIDAHVHSWGDARRDALRFGTTTALDLHGDRGRLTDLKAQRESLARTGEADLWAAGAALTVPDGHGTQFGLAVPTIEAHTDVAAFVDARIGEGSDVIKLIIEDLGAYGGTRRWPTLDARQVGEAIRATHAARRIAIAHASRQADALMAVEAGVDGLGHVFIDETASPAFLEAAKARDLFVVPTLSVMAAGSGSGDGRSLAADARLQAFLTPAQATALAARFDLMDANPRLRENAIASVRALHAAGVTILAGTDAGNPGTAHGASMHGELELLVRAGLTPQQALAAATSLPARRLGLAERGRIAPGMRADLVLVDGDPLADITATRAIVAIWKNGHAVERAPAAATVVAAGIAPAETLISGFDDSGIDAAGGGSWRDTSDTMMGGASSASHRLVAGGAAGSPGALEVEGEIRPGFAFPWAGAMLFVAATPMQPVDYSSRRELVFHARGDGREIRVMLFSGPSEQAMPSMQGFIAGAEWTEHRMPLADFAGADPALLRAIAFSAGEPAGKFRFQIDGVELR